MRQQKPRISELMRDRAREHRKESTKAERKLWYLLRNRLLAGLRFRRQQVIGPYIADFFCADANLIIETDGLSHDGRGDYDERRSKYLESLGYRVLRFLDNDVLQNTTDVMEAVLKAACGSRSIHKTEPVPVHHPHPSPLPSREREYGAASPPEFGAASPRKRRQPELRPAANPEMAGSECSIN